MRGMKLALAPMQDVTDLAFMRTLHRIGSLPDVLVTPYFRSTTTTCALTESNLRCLFEHGTGLPIWAQLAGSDAVALIRDSQWLLRQPIAGINLNAGCPSPLVNRHGAGAGLLRTPARFRDILLALRNSLPAGRFSVKLRLGWKSPEEFPALLELLAEAAPDEVMIHARTRCQLYGGAPDTRWVVQAVQKLACPVLGNGDIGTPELARYWLREVSPAGVMIGRGAVRNPYIFRQLRGGSAPRPEEMKLYYATLMEEIGRLFATRYTERGHCNRMKKYLAFCYADFSESEEYNLRRCTSVREMERILCRG